MDAKGGAAGGAAAVGGAVLVLAGWVVVAAASTRTEQPMVLAGGWLAGAVLVVGGAALGFRGVSRSRYLALIDRRGRWMTAGASFVFFLLAAWNVGLLWSPASLYLDALRAVSAVLFLVATAFNLPSLVLLVGDDAGLRLRAGKGRRLLRVGWSDIERVVVDEHCNPRMVAVGVRLRPGSAIAQPQLRVNDLRIDVPIRVMVARADFDAAGLRRLLDRVDGPGLEFVPGPAE